MSLQELGLPACVLFEVATTVSIEVAAGYDVELFRLPRTSEGFQRDVCWGEDIVIGDGHQKRRRRDTMHLRH